MKTFFFFSCSFGSVSESDCYVTLSLPTVSTRTWRTKTISNNNEPEWNETFTFRVPSHLKNVLEMNLFDEDSFTADDLISTVNFDITKLTVGKKETKVFTLNPETTGELEVEFELLPSEETHDYDTNVVLMEKETVSYLTLNVNILRAKTKSFDYFSESDCYVTLSLPTASTRTWRTKTISNNNEPEWNETFTFRVPRQLKNVLEMNLFDKDSLSADDLISTVNFDITKLTVGKKETKLFPLNPETTGELEVEFELLPSEESQDYDTNGILMAGPFSILHIKVDKSPSCDLLKGKVLKIKGAYPENQTIDSQDQSLCFYINRDLETELQLATDVDAEPVASIKLPPLQAQKYRKSLSCRFGIFSLQHKVDFTLETHEGTKKDLFTRIDYDIPTQEKEYLQKRKAVVAQAVEKILGLNTRLGPNEVPTVAVVASGGGTRAMTGLFGSLRGLKELGVLDAATYITGVSGSTWTMSALYQEANWSQQDINTFISAVRENLNRSISSLFSWEKLQYYYSELKKKADDGYSMLPVDLFGLIIEELVFGKKLNSTLSDQQKTVNEGQNPFPIYTAVNIKDVVDCENEKEWCEFTPYEVGLQKYGAFIPSEALGSQFLLGHKIKERSERRLAYLMGIWSSFFSASISEIWHTQHPINLTVAIEDDESTRDTETTLRARSFEGKYLNNMKTTAVKICYYFHFKSLVCMLSSFAGHYYETAVDGAHFRMASIFSFISELLKDRPFISEMDNFMNGFFLSSDYDKYSYFQAQKENHPDAFPNKLTPTDPTLHMVDSGHAINIGCPPILRPERDVDVIISLNDSWDPQHIVKVMKQTAEYCEVHNIPFPNADYDSLEKEPKKEVYILEDKENPKAPIVIHFPLVNVTYRDYKSPGVKRVTKEEIEAGKVDVESKHSPYTTRHLLYSKEHFDALVDLTTYNIVNNKESIHEVLQKALQRRASKINK
ncbi:cytosolic phospholipase A2 beta-like [Mugil cephalus]|uniref:cytosolic phospholipase A2 beta-like n=1 Tax=Mugil cephalus TaxID=48193 RepID=UPI001FB631A0|nr:cytosolic phospholipase A2 beta-like [Mugil cephalus]